MSDTKISSFINKTLGEVRVVFINDEPWFVAKDVANALGYKNDRDAIIKHISKKYRKALLYKASRDTRLSSLWSGSNDFMQKILISESGMWQLVFRSKLSSALEFQEWIFETVLPSIRKNGGYIDSQEKLPDTERKELESFVSDLHEQVVAYEKECEDLKFELEVAQTELQKEVYENQNYVRMAEAVMSNELLYSELSYLIE